MLDSQCPILILMQAEGQPATYALEGSVAVAGLALRSGSSSQTIDNCFSISLYLLYFAPFALFELLLCKLLRLAISPSLCLLQVVEGQHEDDRELLPGLRAGSRGLSTEFTIISPDCWTQSAM